MNQRLSNTPAGLGRAITLIALLSWGACSDDEGGSSGSGDAGSDVGAGGDAGSVDTGVGSGADADVGGEPQPGPNPFETLFSECSDSGDCGNGEICHQDVCVREPTVEAALWVEESDGYVPLEDAPDLDCWNEPFEFEQDSPATATMQGQVELFGPESPTRNLCVTAYDNELFLRWMVWLDQNVCSQYLDIDLRDQEPYVNCFALDPCRCEEEEFTVNRGDAGESVNACYAEIGFCAGIEGDEAMLAQCRANVLERTSVEADTLILSSAMSEPFPENPDRTEGVYALENIPTNTRMVIKVSGRLRRWRDTYEHGAFVRAENVDEQGMVRFDVNVITDGAWRTIPQSAGIADPIAPTQAAIAGVVNDCGAGDRSPSLLEGVHAGFILDPVTIAYFNGVSGDNLPQPGQAYTNKDAVYAAIGVPGGANRVSLAAQLNDEVVNAGWRDVFAPPFSVVIATFEGNWE